MSYLFNLFPNKEYCKLLEKENAVLIFTVFHKNKVNNIYYVPVKWLQDFYEIWIPHERRLSENTLSVLYKTSFIRSKKITNIVAFAKEKKNYKNRSRIISIDIDKPFSKNITKVINILKEIDKNLFKSSAILKTHGENIRILIFLKDEIDVDSEEWNFLKDFFEKSFAPDLEIDKISPFMTLWDTNIGFHFKKQLQRKKCHPVEIYKESKSFWDARNFIISKLPVNEIDLSFLEHQEYLLELPLKEDLEPFDNENIIEENKREIVKSKFEYYITDEFLEKVYYHINKKLPGFEIKFAKSPTGRIKMIAPQLKPVLRKAYSVIASKYPDELNLKFNFKKLVALKKEKKQLAPQYRMSLKQKSKPEKSAFLSDKGFQNLTSLMLLAFDERYESDFHVFMELSLKIIKHYFNKWILELYTSNLEYSELRYNWEEIEEYLCDLLSWIWKRNRYNDAGSLYNLMKNYSHIITKFVHHPCMIENKKYVTPKFLYFYWFDIYETLAQYCISSEIPYYSSYKGYVISAAKLSKILNKGLVNHVGNGIRLLLPDIPIVLKILGIKYEILYQGKNIFFILKDIKPHTPRKLIQMNIQQTYKNQRIYLIRRFHEFKDYPVARVRDMFYPLFNSEGIMYEREITEILLSSLHGKRLDNLSDNCYWLYYCWCINDYAMPDYKLLRFAYLKNIDIISFVGLVVKFKYHFISYSGLVGLLKIHAKITKQEEVITNICEKFDYVFKHQRRDFRFVDTKLREMAEWGDEDVRRLLKFMRGEDRLKKVMHGMKILRTVWEVVNNEAK